MPNTIKFRENENQYMDYDNYKIVTLAVNIECKWTYVLVYLERRMVEWQKEEELSKINGSWENKFLRCVYLGSENESLELEEKVLNTVN